MPKQKPPIIGGCKPDPNQTYCLDDPSAIKLADINFDSLLPIADEYDHYTSCKWVLIEYKSSSLSDSITQLEETAKQLVSQERKVDHVIIITKGIDDPERNLYTKRGNTLIYKPKNSPAIISTGNKKIEVEIFDPYEIERQYKQYGSSLSAWVSK